MQVPLLKMTSGAYLAAERCMLGLGGQCSVTWRLLCRKLKSAKPRRKTSLGM